MSVTSVYQRNFEQIIEKMGGDPVNVYDPTRLTDGMGNERGDTDGTATLVEAIVRPITAKDYELIDRGWATTSDYIIHTLPDKINERDIIHYPISSSGTEDSDTKSYEATKVQDKARPVGVVAFDMFIMKFLPE